MSDRHRLGLAGAIRKLGLLRFDDAPAPYVEPSTPAALADAQPVFAIEDRRWAVAVVAPHKEAQAADWLRWAHVLAYWPNYQHLVAAKGQRNGFQHRRVQFCSVIPGYLFIAFKPKNGEQHRAIDAVPGFRDFLRGSHGEVRFLMDADIEIVRKIEAGLNRSWQTKAHHTFKVGDKVRFVDDICGRFGIGTVGRLVSNARLSVDVTLLGRLVAVIVHPSQIERSSKAGA